MVSTTFVKDMKLIWIDHLLRHRIQASTKAGQFTLITPGQYFTLMAKMSEWVFNPV